MAWQDIVITIVQAALLIALLPTVFGKDKPALLTSVLTGSMLAVLAFTFATLSLWISALSTGAVSATWLVIAVQTVRRNRTSSES